MSHALRSNGRQAGVIAIWDRIVIVTSLHYCVVAPLHRCNVSTVATAELLHRCTIVCRCHCGSPLRRAHDRALHGCMVCSIRCTAACLYSCMLQRGTICAMSEIDMSSFHSNCSCTATRRPGITHIQRQTTVAIHRLLSSLTADVRSGKPPPQTKPGCGCAMSTHRGTVRTPTGTLSTDSGRRKQSPSVAAAAVL